MPVGVTRTSPILIERRNWLRRANYIGLNS
jgi:hypothetical protein